MLHWWNLMFTISRGKSQNVGEKKKKKAYLCRVCANGAACKYVFPSSDRLTGSETGCKSILWCLCFQRGVGISTGTRRRCSTGNITRLFNWIFLFMIPASPHWIHRTANERRLPGEPRREGGIHYTVQTWEKYQLLCALYVIQWWKTWGW